VAEEVGGAAEAPAPEEELGAVMVAMVAVAMAAVEMAATAAARATALEWDMALVWVTPMPVQLRPEELSLPVVEEQITMDTVWRPADGLAMQHTIRSRTTTWCIPGRVHRRQ
jgi:hypothetical protein